MKPNVMVEVWHGFGFGLLVEGCGLYYKISLQKAEQSSSANKFSTLNIHQATCNNQHIYRTEYLCKLTPKSVNPRQRRQKLDVRNPYGLPDFHRQVHRIVSINKE
ncbi:hypothetical protein PIB30_066463 [Stylosanthes scabra]|uniref:Uncharacterized protein n=1 Tax=Stylosanthes scabra TaxID=79078 RepID=A0ABU6TM23_9FABA|nr:hypothetical protein [Stylosanthes scabra]